MSNFNFPTLNGIAASWADIQVRLSVSGASLVEMGDIKNINSAWDIEEGEQQEGGIVIKRTAGAVKNAASMTLYASGYDRMWEVLAAQAPLRNGQRRIGLVFFDVNILWTPFGAVKIKERRLKNCRILGSHNDSGEGVDATEFEVPLSPLQVVDVVNGVEIVPL